MASTTPVPSTKIVSSCCAGAIRSVRGSCDLLVVFSASSPHILRLAMTAGIGGLLFGYDTGTLYSLTSSFFLFLLNLVLSL